MIRNFGSGPAEVAAALRPMLADASATEAVRIIERDFTAHDGLGARRVAEFLTGGPDDDIQASVVGFARRFLNSL